ncbi:unnamed protein product [Penicillium manginii]
MEEHQKDYASGPSAPIFHDQRETYESSFQRNTFLLVEKLLFQQKESRYYQARLEHRISDESAAHHRLRSYCLQLERSISMYEHAKSQAEASLRCAASNCQTLGRDLEDERKKVQQMENVIHLSPTVDELLRLLSHGGAGTQHDFALLHRETVGQREIIEHLQAALKAREETADAMGTALEEASTALSHTQHGDLYNEYIKDYDDDDSVTIITNGQPPFFPTS